jgi:predicted alpha/beta-fold hydrolase
MAIIKSKYKAPFLFRNAHVATVLPSLFRKVDVDYQRERIDIPDGDFLDIDWIKNGNSRVVIVSHGLEGNTGRHYVAGTANRFSSEGWDVAAWNCRSCSDELNLLPRLYSHIDAPDLAVVVEHCLKNEKYKEIALVGFSMGGAITLNYLTKMQEHHPVELNSAVAISAPVDVGASADELEKIKNTFYRNRFIKKMAKRIKRKADQFPDLIDVEGVDDIRTFAEYDIRFTAPLNHCNSPYEFYQKASTINDLQTIKVPTLLLIAENDPFMPESCYPYKDAKDHKYFHLEVPKKGGHVGFTINSLQDSWMEERAFEFINQKE